MAAIEEELTCCVCLDMFKDPVILTCSHNLCRTCGLQLAKQHKPMMIICPHCRFTTPFEAVRQNRTLANIVAVFESQKKSQEVTASGDSPVMACSSDGACEDEEYCNVHTGRWVEAFCQTCNRKACDMCICMKPMEQRSTKHKIMKLDEFKMEHVCEKYMKQIHELETLRDELVARAFSIADNQAAVQATCLKALAESDGGIRQMEKLLRQRWKTLHLEYTTHVGQITAKYERSLSQIKTLQSQADEFLAEKSAVLQTGSLLNLQNGSMSLSRFLSKASNVLTSVQAYNSNVANATKSRVLNFDLVTDVINGLSWTENETDTLQGATAVGGTSSQYSATASIGSVPARNGESLFRAPTFGQPLGTSSSCVSTTGSGSLQPTSRSVALRSAPRILREARFTYPGPSTATVQQHEQEQSSVPVTCPAYCSTGARPKAIPTRPTRNPMPPLCSVLVQDSTPNQLPAADESQSQQHTNPVSKRQTTLASSFMSSVASAISSYASSVPTSFQFVSSSRSVSSPELSFAAGTSTTAPSFCGPSISGCIANGSSGVESDAASRPTASWSSPATSSIPSSAFTSACSLASSNRVHSTEPTAIFSLGKMATSTQTVAVTTTTTTTTTTSTAGSSVFSLMPSMTSDWGQKFTSLFLSSNPFSAAFSSGFSDPHNKYSDSTTSGTTNTETFTVSGASASSRSSGVSFPAGVDFTSTTSASAALAGSSVSSTVSSSFNPLSIPPIHFNFSIPSSYRHSSRSSSRRRTPHKS